MSRETGKLLRQVGIEKVWYLYKGDAIQIARDYGLAKSNVYLILKEYCIKNNLQYKDFLRYPHKPHRKPIYRMVLKKKSQRPQGILPKKGVKGQRARIFKRINSDKDIDFLIEILKISTAEDIEDISDAAKSLIIQLNKMIKKTGG